MRKVVFSILLIWGGLFLADVAGATVWSNIRDGVVHVAVAESLELPVTVSVAWKDVWISESQEDHFFIQKPDGSLLDRHILNRDNTPGQITYRLEQPGNYRLEVTGASFRNITVAVPAGVKSMLEPVKVHKSVELPRNGQLFFRVPAKQSFSFAAKNYGGVKSFLLTNSGNEDSFTLDCREHVYYSEFDRKKFAAQENPTIQQLSWDGKGKVAFWLDGVANLFTQRPGDFFELKPGEVEIQVRIDRGVIGPTPALGVAFPFIAPPAAAAQIIDHWQLSAASHYVFVDYYQREENRGVDFKEQYERRFHLLKDNAIFGITGRKMVFSSMDKVAETVLDYLASSARSADCETYFAFADEPNLNYGSYGQYARQFGRIAAEIKSHPNPKINHVLLATPQSSRFLNGPTRSGAEKRRGYDWAEKLIQDYGQYIDALSWHEWLVRDLIDTGRYREAVEKAYGLVLKYRNRFTREPALIIGQTNISSGPTLSPYENDTFFAALWWTSVVIQSSLPGKLQQLVWFKVEDDKVYKKGLLAIENGIPVEKPVAGAMAFINRNLGKWVLPVQQEHPELDLLATLSDDKKRLMVLGVNKSSRPQFLQISLPFSCTDGTAASLNETGSQEIDYTAVEAGMGFRLAGETIFSLQCEVGES